MADDLSFNLHMPSFLLHSSLFIGRRDLLAYGKGDEPDLHD